MAIFRGAGGAGDATTDSSSQALAAINAAAEAEVSATEAASSASAAATSATSAASSATAAASSASSSSSSATSASTSATNAASSASDAADSESNAAASATAAAASATTATTKASEAASSATAAASSASAAATSATNAASSATAAASSALAASTSETNAAASETAAATSETNAASSESAAATSATNAANSATSAATSATNASNSATAAATSATNAATSATNASNSATAAATSETNAANSASAASTSATNASNSATSAATSATNAATSYDNFDDRYLGNKSSAPSVDNDGDPLLTGALYFDTTSNSMKVYSGSAWLDAYASLSGALLATNNLSDLNDVPTARTNLGLGTAALVADDTLVHLAGTETITGAKTFSTNPTVSSGTANGVAYLNGSKVLTTGSALTFDGTNLGIGTSSPSDYYAGAAKLVVAGSSESGITIANTTSTSNGFLYFADGTTGTAEYAGYLQYSHTNDFLALGTAATERMRINSSGNVGIGTSSYSNRLTVVDSQATSGGYAAALIRQGGVAGNNGIIVDVTNAPGQYVADFRIANSSVMKLDNAGNLGLGVTPSTWTVGKAFEVGYVGNGLWGNSQTASYHTVNAYYNGGWRYGGTGEATFYVQNAGQHRWHTAPSGTAGTAISFTQAMTLNASGNLGIGTSSPSYKLDVSKGSAGTAARFTASTDNGRGLSFTSSDNGIYLGAIWTRDVGSAAGIHAWAINASEKMRLDAAGNLGLGVTPSVWYGGYSVMQLGQAGSIYAYNLSGNSNLFVGENTYLNSSGVDTYIRSDLATKYRQGDGTHYWYTAPSGTAGTAISFTQAMTLDASGRLGIGTSSPTDKLSIYGGSVRLTNATTGTTGADGYSMETSGLNAYLWNYEAGFLSFATSATERMRIDSSGNVGIGTSSPSSKLEVTDNIKINGANPALRFLNGDAAEMYIQCLQVANGGRALRIFDSAAGSERMRIDSSGTLGLGVTPSAWVSGNKAMQIADLALSSYVDNRYSTVTHNAYYDASWKYKNSKPAVLFGLDQNIGGFTWQTAPSGTAGAAISFTQAMTLDASGNLGIGTSSPATYGLTVQKNQSGVAGISLRNTNTGASVYSGIYFGGATAATDGFIGSLGDSATAYGGARSLVLGTNTATPVVVMTGGTEKMRIDSSGNLLFNSGYGSAATAYGCRAWVNFNGTGTVAIRASGNVSSITDNGTGDYTINFSTAIVDANYSSQLASSQNSAAQYAVTNMVSQSTTALRVQNSNLGAALVDNANMLISIFR